MVTSSRHPQLSRRGSYRRFSGDIGLREGLRLSLSAVHAGYYLKIFFVRPDRGRMHVKMINIDKEEFY